MPSDDAHSNALRDEDFYALLDIAPGIGENEIRRAYRRTALKYHPDKHGGSTEAVEKFHLLQIAYDVLSDPVARGVYDNAQQAKHAKVERERALGADRRRMKEDLDGRERAAKRAREGGAADDELQAKIRRLAADGARRRLARMEELRKEEEQRTADEQAKEEGGDMRADPGEYGSANGTPAEPPSEMDRAIKVKWLREGTGETIDKQVLENMFKRFGPVEMVIVLKDKKKKSEDGRAKVMLATGLVVYKSIASTFHAMQEGKNQSDEAFASIDGISWGNTEEPEVIRNLRAGGQADGSPGKPASAGLTLDEYNRIRLRIAAKRQKETNERLAKEAEEARNEEKAETARPTIRTVPSFASFKNASTPRKGTATPASASPFSVSTPGQEQLRKQRLREQEIRRLEAEEAAAAEADES